MAVAFCVAGVAFGACHVANPSLRHRPSLSLHPFPGFFSFCLIFFCSLHLSDTTVENVRKLSHEFFLWFRLLSSCSGRVLLHVQRSFNARSPTRCNQFESPSSAEFPIFMAWPGPEWIDPRRLDSYSRQQKHSTTIGFNGGWAAAIYNRSHHWEIQFEHHVLHFSLHWRVGFVVLLLHSRSSSSSSCPPSSLPSLRLSLSSLITDRFHHINVITEHSYEWSRSLLILLLRGNSHQSPISIHSLGTTTVWVTNMPKCDQFRVLVSDEFPSFRALLSTRTLASLRRMLIDLNLSIDDDIRVYPDIDVIHK